MNALANQESARAATSQAVTSAASLKEDKATNKYNKSRQDATAVAGTVASVVGAIALIAAI